MLYSIRNFGMSLLTQTNSARIPEHWVPTTEEERRQAHEQLARLLASPLFLGSKRCAKLLSFITKAVLDGRGDHLKERNLGVDVFERDCNYDTNRDPVVRTTAVDIRRRLAQYYQDPLHTREMVITLPPGSYVPQFRHIEAAAELAQAAETSSAGPVIPSEPALHTAPSPAATTASPWSRWSRWWLAAATATVAMAATAALLPHEPPPALDLFWAPVLDTNAPVLLLIGGTALAGTAPEAPPKSIIDLQNSERVSFADATTLSRIASAITAHGKRFQIRQHSQANLEDLQQGPVVLIGANNNEWTLRLTRQSRFFFEHEKDIHYGRIIDRQGTDRDRYLVKEREPYSSAEQDFALISRLHDPTTGRIVVTAAGITKYGTAAAGEFLSDPKYMQQVARSAPPGWQNRDLQILIATKIVGQSSGPPRVLATDVR